MKSSVRTDFLSWLHCSSEYSADLRKYLLAVGDDSSTSSSFVEGSAFRDGDFFVNFNPDFNQTKISSNANKTTLMRTGF